MAAKTPSTLFNVSIGSLKGTIARFEASGHDVDSGDYWASGITDVVSVFGNMKGSGSTASTTGLAVSFTATDGTIFMFPATESSYVDLLVLSGNGNAN